VIDLLYISLRVIIATDEHLFTYIVCFDRDACGLGLESSGLGLDSSGLGLESSSLGLESSGLGLEPSGLDNKTEAD